MKLAVVMDPIEQIKPEKDGTLDLMLSAQSFGYDLTRFHTEQLRISDGKPLGIGRSVTVSDDANSWFTYGAENEHCLSDFDVILMRKDPPFDMEYIYSTYILDLAKMSGVKVINDPAARCAPGSVDLTDPSVTAGSTGSGTLTYWQNSGASTPLSNPNSVNTTGTYYIQSDNGCEDIEAVNVTINPSPVLSTH